jgi:predicted permease
VAGKEEKVTLVFIKIFSVFSISLFGYAANKLNWLPAESTKYLSILLLNISTPCFVLYSMSRQQLDGKTVASVLQSFGLMFLALVITSLLAIVSVRIMRAPAADRGVYRTLLVLTNSGFMGFPLSYAVFGHDGLFLMIIANSCFVFYAYSIGIALLVAGKDEKRSWKTALKSMISIPGVSCVAGLLIFGFGIRLPDLLMDFLNSVGAITVPLSMIIIGIQLAESKAGDVLKNRHLFLTVILRLAVIPSILFGLFMWLPVQPLVLCIVTFGMAMPSASLVPIFADIYGGDAKLGAQGVFITTVFSLISIPISALLLTLYLGA